MEVPSSTLPLYSLVPAPFSMPWYSKIFLPVSASVMTCSWLGVPSFWKPPTTVSYARTGAPLAAQITLRGALSEAALSPETALETFSALCCAAFGATFGVSDATLMVAFVDLVTSLTLPFLAWCTTRSPPSTGSPAYVRSYRVCTVPSTSLMTSLTTSFSCEPRPSVCAAFAVVALALCISSTRCEGESLTDWAPSSLAWGAAPAEPVVRPVVTRAAAVAMAAAADIRVARVLTRTPSCCGGSGRTAGKGLPDRNKRCGCDVRCETPIRGAYMSLVEHQVGLNSFVRR